MKRIRTFFILSLAVAGTVQAVPPMRLQIAAMRGTVPAGERAGIDVQFLGRDYTAVANDINRVVTFMVLPLDRSGAGNITPSISVPPGATHSAGASFQCISPGRFQIIARSDGLVEAQTIVVGVQRPTSRIENWLFPVVQAASSPSVQILPRQWERGLIANGKSQVRLKLLLGDMVSRGKQANIILTTSGEAKVTYHGQDKYAPVIIQISEGNQISDDIILTSTIAQDLKLMARDSASSHPDTVPIKFALPKPSKVYVEVDKMRAEVGVEDQDRVKIRNLDTEHTVNLIAPGDPEHTLISIDRPRVHLTPQTPIHQRAFTLTRYPPRGEIKLQAQDTDGDLDSGETILSVDNPVRKVSISGSRQVRTSDRECSVLVTLLNEHGKKVAPEWDTPVILHSDQLKVPDKTGIVPRGQYQKTFTLKLPRSSGRVTVTGSLPEVASAEQGTYGLAIIAAMYVLILLACVGGIAGALARQFYYEEVRFLKPRWVDGCLRPGLMGNTTFGALFGTIAFIAFEAGLFRRFEIWASISDSWGDASMQLGPVALAFLLGFVGGYGGPGLLDRILQIKRKPEPAAAAAVTP